MEKEPTPSEKSFLTAVVPQNVPLEETALRDADVRLLAKKLLSIEDAVTRSTKEEIEVIVPKMHVKTQAIEWGTC